MLPQPIGDHVLYRQHGDVVRFLELQLHHPFPIRETIEQVSRHRNRIERCFGRLKPFRRFATPLTTITPSTSPAP